MMPQSSSLTQRSRGKSALLLTTAVVAASLLLFSVVTDQRQSSSLQPPSTRGRRLLLQLSSFGDPKTSQAKPPAQQHYDGTDRRHRNMADSSSSFGPDEFPYPLTCDKNDLTAFLRNADLIDNQTGEKKIAINIVYHIGMVGNWKTVVEDQFNTMNQCGLLDAADRLYLTYSNGDGGILPLMQKKYSLHCWEITFTRSSQLKSRHKVHGKLLL